MSQAERDGPVLEEAIEWMAVSQSGSFDSSSRRWSNGAGNRAAMSRCSTSRAMSPLPYLFPQY